MKEIAISITADVGAAAAAFDDFGTIDASDAVLILGYVFLRDEPPAEPGPVECGFDEEFDVLPICNGPGCA